MDSYSDNLCLQARIRDLERENIMLRETNTQLVKENEKIFYKMTKEDFMILMDKYSEDIANYTISAEQREEFWKIWKEQFEKRFDSTDVYDAMLFALTDILSEYRHILHPSPHGK